MIYSKAGLQLTEAFEGVRLTAYQDVRGRWTIGYGHTGPDVHAGLVWTQQQAEDALAKDIAWAASVVTQHVTFPINQAEFDALVDFVFNDGSGNFARSSMLIMLNHGRLSDAAAQFQYWDHAAGSVVAGLLRRREAEAQEFLSGVPA